MKIYIFYCIIVILLISSSARAAITSVTLTAAPPTTMSNGQSYYCAGVQYTFRIQATDPAAPNKAYWRSAAAPPPHTINVTFPGVASFYVDLPGDSSGGTNMNVVSVTDNSGVYTTIDYTVVVQFLWNATAVAAGANNVTATVIANNGAAMGNNIRTFNFGVISQIAVLNFAQNGDAADGMVNPWHDAFDVTGRIVYYSNLQNIITQVPLAEITGLTLYRQVATPAGVTVINSGTNNNFQYAVPAAYFAFGALTAATATTGAYSWTIDATMLTGGATEPVVGSLGVTVGMVSVSAAGLGGFAFVNGGGVNYTVAGTYYVRSRNVPGTELQLTATAAMLGTVTFTVTDDQGTLPYHLQITNINTTGKVLLGTVTDPYPAIAAGTITPVNYTVQSVTGGAYGNTTPGGGQNAPGRILNSISPANRYYWENAHPPGLTPASWIGPDQLDATSITIHWTPLSTGGPYFDGDFSSYRIYYRQSTPTPWLMLDRNTHPALLGNIVTGTFTIGGVGNELIPLTSYDYRVSAIDVFGNEVPLASQISHTVVTTAITVQAAVTDGISTYDNASFSGNPTNPASHVVRKTAIKVTVYMVTAGTVPEQVNIIIANNDSDLFAQHGLPAGANDDILSLVNGTTRWTIPCVKVTANTYEALIPSEHPLMVMKTNIRFIVETIKSGTPTYSDHNPLDNTYWTDEWRFRVDQPAIFFPWPTRVLNNVLTSAIPCCWPAYFLTVDSLVTIKVYDVKGRVINVLADKMYRPGGQNIKENGWCGTNKDNRRVGPGLYYIHIKAITFGGKVTLDKMLKVVVAH